MPTASPRAAPPKASLQALAPWVRVAGQHAPAAAVLDEASAWLAQRGITVTHAPATQSDDYTQVDLLLDVAETAQPAAAVGVGYAGFTPGQRSAFLRWASHPDEDGPPAFRQLYCASLDVHLVESAAAGDGSRLTALLTHLQALADASPWRHDPFLTQTRLLGARLTGDGALAQADTLAPQALGVALGIQATAASPAPLDAAQVCLLAQLWRLSESPPLPSLIALRLAEDAAQQGDLLQRALRLLDPAAQLAKPFRLSHRDLRLAFAQPDLRAPLEPLLVDLLAVLEGEEDEAAEEHAETEAVAAAEAAAAAEGPSAGEAPAPARESLPRAEQAAPKAKRRKTKDAHSDGKDWQLVLEFAESRSQYAPFALDIAQKMPGYTTLLDEDRTIVHRITYRKSELRRFWRLWDFVQGWNSVRVYLNGEELEKWQVWPWSQYLR